MRSQTAGDKDGRGAVRTADDADGAGLCGGESVKARDHAGQAAACVGHEDAQLGGRAQQQGLGVGDQGTEVGARAHAHEDEAGVDAQLDAQIQYVKQAHGDGLSHLHRIDDIGGYPQVIQFVNKRLVNGMTAEDLPVDVSAGKENLMIHLRAGQVGDEHTEGNRQQQQGLELLHNRQVQQDEGDDHHNQDLPVPRGNLIEAGRLNEIHDSFHLIFLPASRP